MADENSPLQMAPLGLLGAFLLKVQGRNPDKFSNTLQPVAEVGELYYLTRAQIQQNGGNVIATGSAAVLTCPASQIWRVKGVGFSAVRAAADIALVGEFSVNLERGVVLGTPIMNGNLGTTTASTLAQSRGVWLPRPLYLRGGDVVRLLNRTTWSANCAVSLSLDLDVIDL